MASKLRISATHESRGSKKLSNICAILLDLDGVVIDSEPAHERSLIEASDRLGRRITLSEAKQFKGSTELDCARILREMTDSAEDLTRIMQLRLDAFRTFFKEVTLVEGVLLFLRRCKAKKWPVALTTSAQREIQELAFRQFSLAGYFDFVVTGNDIIHGKPHPEPYVRTAEKIGYPPSRCLVVEDSTNGVRSAKTAGCQTVGITTSVSSDALFAAGADIVVPGFPEVSKILFKEGSLRADYH